MGAETMQAVVCHGPQDYRIEDVPRPRPGRGELLVEVGAVGICASDIKCFSGASLSLATTHQTLDVARFGSPTLPV